MKTFDLDFAPLYRHSVGFDSLAPMLLKTLNAGAAPSGNFPPYDIKSYAENRYTISLAVAGFTQKDIDIQVERGILTIRGNKQEREDDSSAKVLHKGIANRSFERKFNLADHVEVTAAELDHGMLTISLVKETPEAMKPKRIDINATRSGQDKAA